MRTFPTLCFLSSLAGLWFSGLEVTLADSVVPDGAAMAAGAGTMQRLLLNPLEVGDVITAGKWRMASAAASPASDLDAKAGGVALRFQGDAQQVGAKGDFLVCGAVPGEPAYLGAWFHLAPSSNVSKLGFQVQDGEGELLLTTVAADWEAWRFVEVATPGGEGVFQQAYPQADKNGKIDFPIKQISIIWFTADAGPSSFGADGLCALTKLPDSTGNSLDATMLGAAWGEPGRPYACQVLLTNKGPEPVRVEITHRIQRNPDLYDRPPPDPVYGSDHAQGRPSWLEIEGKRIDDTSLTDNDENTSYSSEYQKDRYTEGFQFVDLGQVRKITKITYRAGDANWVYKVDLAASDDGVEYRPVEGLQGMDWYKKWAIQTLPVAAPFSARYLRLRYHHDAEKMTVIRTPNSLEVYDGAADEVVEIPRVGETVDEGVAVVEVPARGFAFAPIVSKELLGPDAYLVGSEVKGPDGKRLTVSPFYVMPDSSFRLRAESRFGMNASQPDYIPQLKRLGVGWVRFENMKWRFYNPGPGDFRFDGTVEPWVVPFDEYMKRYTEAGFSVLPYIFQTPDWASSAPADVEKNKGGWPPADPSKYGDAVFEAVARYGSKTYPPEKLQAKDPKSGLAQIGVFELWNEPNLNAKDWGFYVGPIEGYFDLFRVGAEAVRRADPKALISNGGWAGISLELVDRMQSYKYPDGKSPRDFTDILNVHYYTGRQDPEVATADPNVQREGVKPAASDTLEAQLIDLADWRDEYMPKAPIWLTETGYDVGGPIGRSERHQAAKLPRNLMIALANGIEKVFVYRETGSKAVQHGGAGVLRDDASVRPSFFTMATLIRQLDGIQETRVPRLRLTDERAWAYRWRGGGKDVLAAWTYEGRVPLGIDLGKCRVTNAFGGVKEMVVDAKFEVGDLPVYISQFEKPQALDRLEEAAKAAERVRLEVKKRALNAHVYLFDFGSEDELGYRTIGKFRMFSPVLAETVYEEGKGYGFVAAAEKNDHKRWMRSALDGDHVKMRAKDVFRVKAAPGTYRLEWHAESEPAGAGIVLRGAAGGNPVSQLATSTEIGRAAITVGPEGILEFEASVPTRMYWIALVEETK